MALEEIVGEGAAVLSLIEIGLGGVLHTFHIPLAGQALSLNQGFLLTRYSRAAEHTSADPFVSSRISTTAAILKSLSPAGKKLTPMLAIQTQGLLFNFGTITFGRNAFGYCFGMILLSLWAYVQPLLIYVLIYGKTFFDILNTSPFLVWTGVAFVLIKCILGIGLVALAYLLPEEIFQKYRSYLIAKAQKKIPTLSSAPSANLSRATHLQSLKGALHDLMRLPFLISLIITAGFFIYSESSHSTIIWGLLRPIAVAFIIFYLVRIFPVEKWFSAESNSSFVKSARLTIEKIKS
jgi:hypothetical protein